MPMPSSDAFGMEVNVAYQFDDLLFREISYPLHGGRPSHVHEEAQLIFFLKGQVKEVRKRQTFLRIPSTLILLPADEPHATDFLEGVKTFQILIPSSWTERVPQVSPLMERPADYQNGLPIQIAMRLYREFQSRDTLTPLMLEGLMLELLAQMARNATENPEIHCPRWLKQVEDFLHSHFAESPSLETIAAVVGVHPSHLIRVFRQNFHCTIGDYLRHLRMEQARRHLSVSDTPLSEIALALGYSDQSHFTTAFKRQTGLSPAKYRKMCRER